MRFNIIIVFLLCLVSCVSLKEQHITTANKVYEYLLNGRVEKVQSMITGNPDIIGNDIEAIKHDSELFKQLINKYGKQKKITYSVDSTEKIIPYKVIFTIFQGKDTFMNWEISNAYLQIDFGPKRFNKPTKITHYQLVIDKIKYLNEIK